MDHQSALSDRSAAPSPALQQQRYEPSPTLAGALLTVIVLVAMALRWPSLGD